MIRHLCFELHQTSDKKLPLVEIQGLLKEKVLLLFLLKFGELSPPQVPTAPVATVLNETYATQASKQAAVGSSKHTLSYTNMYFRLWSFKPKSEFDLRTVLWLQCQGKSTKGYSKKQANCLSTGCCLCSLVIIISIAVV